MITFKDLRIFATIGVTLVVAASLHAQTVIKLATVSPEGSALMTELRSAAKAVDERTEGRVKLKFYSGGVMGDDYAVIRKIRFRQLSGAILQTGVFSSIAKDVNVYNLPMQFKNLDEVSAVRKNLDSVLQADLEEAGYESFGFLGLGLAYAMGNSPATSVSEARSLKVWIPKGDPSASQTLKTFGISPTPLTIVDVLAGLQTGLVDIVTSPPVAAVALQWHVHIDYILDLPFLYVFSIFVVDKRTFAQISEEDQVVVRDLLDDAVRSAEATGAKDHSAAFQVLLDQGVKLLTPSQEDRDEWQRIADNASSDWISQGIISQSIYDQFQASLDNFRNTGG